MKRNVIAAIMLAVLLVGLTSLMLGCRNEQNTSQLLRVNQHTFQSAVVTDTNGTAMDTSQLATLGIQVEGIVTATVTFQATIDNATWYAVQATNRNSGSAATSTTADGIFAIDVAEFKWVRCPVSSWISGTITVSGLGSTD
jgi:hypothetical protein